MFHWNETARFDRIVKKRQTRWRVVWYCSSSSFFHLKAAKVATFSKHLMLHLSTKPYTNMMVWHLTIPWYGSFWSIDTATASAAPPPINRDEFHVMGKKKFEAKVFFFFWGGGTIPPVSIFFSPCQLSPISSAIVAATSHMLVFLAPPTSHPLH